MPQSHPTSEIALATILVIIFTALTVLQIKQRPWLFVGWFWFLGMLVPVLGLVQVGLQAMADRYTYLPMLGLQIALLWTLRDFLLRNQNANQLVVPAAAVILGGCMTRTWNQIQFWQSSKTLYEHALAVTKGNYLAESDLATTLFNEGNLTDAETHFRRAVTLKPDFATARFKLALTLDELDRSAAALDAYQKFLKLRPRDPLANYNAGVLSLNQNQPGQAMTCFQAAIESKSNYTAAFVGLGLAKMRLDETGDAINAFQQALKLDPNFPGVTGTLTRLQRENGQFLTSTNSISKINTEPGGIPETASSP